MSTILQRINQHKRLFTLALLVAIVGGMVSFALPTTNAQTDATCDQADDFMDVSTYVQMQNYPAPELTVTCNEATFTVESNGIPNYEFVAITPNDLQEQNYNWEIPLNPTLAPETTDIPLLGVVAVAVNGLPIFGPNEAPRNDYGDPVLDELLDYCNGHTGGNSDYHLHARPDCLFTDMEGNTSLVIAYAFDGFPVLAPYFCTDLACTDVVEAQSSWVRTTDVTNAWEAHEYIEGEGNLDQCNGMTLPDGSYAYFATDTFPYFLGCYTGVVDDALVQGGDAGGPPQNGNGQQPPQGANGQQPPEGNGEQTAQVGNGQQPPQGSNGNPPPRGGGNGNPPPPPNGG